MLVIDEITKGQRELSRFVGMYAHIMILAKN
jgi:hypothetical protein